mmetsp:Transcript_110452/g.330391  ORF Transcript_110452/g.330391 Transcript_110452/m.330391 type:complete len:204 (-) Transcript_110452:888-1499(-)
MSGDRMTTTSGSCMGSSRLSTCGSTASGATAGTRLTATQRPSSRDLAAERTMGKHQVEMALGKSSDPREETPTPPAPSHARPRPRRCASGGRRPRQHQRPASGRPRRRRPRRRLPRGRAAPGLPAACPTSWRGTAAGSSRVPAGRSTTSRGCAMPEPLLRLPPVRARLPMSQLAVEMVLLPRHRRRPPQTSWRTRLPAQLPRR